MDLNSNCICSAESIIEEMADVIMQINNELCNEIEGTAKHTYWLGQYEMFTYYINWLRQTIKDSLN